MPIFPSMPEDESDKLLKRELCYSISGDEVTDTVTGFSNACLLSDTLAAVSVPVCIVHNGVYENCSEMLSSSCFLSGYKPNSST